MDVYWKNKPILSPIPATNFATSLENRRYDADDDDDDADDDDGDDEKCKYCCFTATFVHMVG